MRDRRRVFLCCDRIEAEEGPSLLVVDPALVLGEVCDRDVLQADVLFKGSDDVLVGCVVQLKGQAEEGILAGQVC